MLPALIKIRAKQLFRSVKDIGLIRIVFLLGVSAYLCLLLFKLMTDYKNAYYVVAGWLFLIAFIHIKRPDKHFLKINATNRTVIFVTEYLLMSVPLILGLIYHLQLLQLVFFFLGICLVSQINYKFKKNNLNTQLQQLIPDEMYEWKAGVRKTLFVVLSIWILGLCTSFFVGGVPVVLFIILITIIGFYEHFEPYQIMVAQERNSQQFILRKIKLNIIAFSIIALPLIFAFLIFNIEYWYIIIAEYFILIILQIFAICTKYNYYEPNTKSPTYTMILGFAVFGSIFFVLFPVVIVMTFVFYFRAKSNLNSYLNDFN